MRDADEPLLIPETRKEDTVIKRVWLESKKLWDLAGPAIFIRVVMFSVSVISQAFAGHLGNLELASISIATTVIITISFGFLLGMASALDTLCGRAYGAKEYHMMGIYLQRSWVVLFLFSILLLPMYLFATPLLKLIGQSNEVAEMCGMVTLWLIPLHFSFVFQFPLQIFLQCQMKNFVLVWVSGGTFAAYVILTWFFVYKHQVGLVGIAIIIDLSWWVSAFGLFGYTIFGGCLNSWRGFSIQAFSGLREFFKLSAASGIMLCLENWYYRMLIIVAGVLSKDEIALDGLSICMSIYAWASMIALGFMAATGVRVATELGAGNAKAAKFSSIVSVATSLVVGFIFWCVIFIFPNQIGQIFTSSPPVEASVNQLSVLLSFTILLNSIQPVLSGVAVGCGWQERVAYINLGSYYIIGVPLGILMWWIFDFGIQGIWAGMLSGTAVQTLILTFVTVEFFWKIEVNNPSEATSHIN